MRKRSLIAVVIVAILAGGVWIASRVATRHFDERLAGLRQENERLRGQLAAAIRPEPAPPRETEPARAAPAPAVEPHVPAPDAHQQALANLRASLADANAAVGRLEFRVQELEDQVQKLAVDNKRLAASETDLNDNLSSANRAIEAQRKELNTKAERLAQLEASTQTLRQQAAGATQKSAQITRLSADLQALDRRRENYLSSILRRYKDITEQYRTFAAAFDDRRTPDAPHTGGPDMGRLQNAITQAEDDLRQLGTLSAQIQALQTKIRRILES